jgi:GNAT superfamily N-acetyltransferase
MKEHGWSVRAYREGDEEGIYELYQAVYPSKQPERDRWMRWWRWMYRTGPAGNGQIWVADHSGRIVGQYPTIFTQIKVKNEILKVSQNIDLMTHPDYRHQGISQTLEKKALDELGKQEIHLTIGFPNKAAYFGHKKAGWFDIASMKVTLKPLNWKNTIRLKIKNRLLSGLLAAGAALVFNRIPLRTHQARQTDGLVVSQITSFDERFDRLWTRVSGQYPIIMVRNKDYLNWRFCTPGSSYLILTIEEADEVRGYLVLREKTLRSKKVSIIFDTIAESEEIMHRLISEAVGICQRKGIDCIVYNLIAGRTYHRVLKSNGFIFPPFTKGADFCAYSSATQIPQKFLKNPKNWFVQTADSDTL